VATAFVFAVVVLLTCCALNEPCEAARGPSIEYKSLPFDSEIVSSVGVPSIAMRTFQHDVRRPRAPRVRGERPTSGVAEVEVITALVVLFLMQDDTESSPFEFFGREVSPISGHPLELLRPPSLA